MTTIQKRQANNAVLSEGYEARTAGASFDSCPQAYIGTPDRLWWQQGWSMAQQDIDWESSNGDA